jgi:hypothetical protein
VAALAVSATAVREALGAWAALQPVGRRPDATAWRDAVAVAVGLDETARRLLRGADDATAPWDAPVTVAAQPRELARQVGLPPERVRQVVDWLVSARLADLVERVGDEWSVRLRATLLADAPVLAAISWDAVRTRLWRAAAVGGRADAQAPGAADGALDVGIDGATDGALPAALAVVRELARRTTPGARAAAHFERLTVLELGELTGFGKSALRTGVAACVRAALVEVRTRERVASYYRLLPGAFGHDAAPAPVADLSAAPALGPAAGPAAGPAPALGPDGPPTPHAGHSVRAVGRRPVVPVDASVAPAVSAAPDAGVIAAVPTGIPAPAPASPLASPLTSHLASSLASPPAAGPAAAPAAVLEIGGVPFPLPPGVHPTLEQDVDGRYWYRVGAVRLGPLTFG